MSTIETPCPSCGHRTLFIGAGGHLTCSLIGCEKPGVERSIAALKKKVENYKKVFDPACEIAHEYLRDEVPLGGNVFDGISKVVKERDSLREEVRKLTIRAEVDWDRCSALTSEVKDLRTKLSTAERSLREALDFVRFKVGGWREWDRREGQSPLAFIEEEASAFLAQPGAGAQPDRGEMPEPSNRGLY